MTDINFTRATIPVQVAAKVLKMDCQTVRLLIQSGAVNWGICFKRGNSRHYSYLIYAKAFYETTGFRYSPEKKGGASDD